MQKCLNTLIVQKSLIMNEDFCTTRGAHITAYYGILRSPCCQLISRECALIVLTMHACTQKESPKCHILQVRGARQIVLTMHAHARTLQLGLSKPGF